MEDFNFDAGFEGNCSLSNEYGVLCAPYDDDFWGYEGPFYSDDGLGE